MKKTVAVFLIAFVCTTQFSFNLESTKLSFTKIPDDFTSDGCSLFPDGDYLHCCVAHDEKYFFGGTWRQRLEADKDFYRCVKTTKPDLYHDVLARIMWIGVRLGGASVWPTSYRWGFGRDIVDNWK